MALTAKAVIERSHNDNHVYFCEGGNVIFASSWSFCLSVCLSFTAYRQDAIYKWSKYGLILFISIYYAIRQPDIVIQHDTAIQKLKKKHKTTQK